MPEHLTVPSGATAEEAAAAGALAPLEPGVHDAQAVNREIARIRTRAAERKHMSGRPAVLASTKDGGPLQYRDEEGNTTPIPRSPERERAVEHLYEEWEGCFEEPPSPPRCSPPSWAEDARAGWYGVLVDSLGLFNHEHGLGDEVWLDDEQAKRLTSCGAVAPVLLTRAISPEVLAAQERERQAAELRAWNEAQAARDRADLRSVPTATSHLEPPVPPTNGSSGKAAHRLARPRARRPAARRSQGPRSGTDPGESEPEPPGAPVAVTTRPSKRAGELRHISFALERLLEEIKPPSEEGAL